jgi:hypothetical protein
MTTLHPQARDKAGIFATTPPSVHTACRALILATTAAVDCEGTYFEQKRLSDARREAAEECERVIGDHQGASYLSGLYRVDGWLVGFRKINKCGLTLVVYPTDETKRGLQN